MSQPSRALIIGAGADVPQNLPCIAPGTLVICADAGIEHAERWGITPHLVVGDLDSATGDVEGWCLENGIELMRFPVEKDKTDVELAIDVAVSRQVTQITLVGVWGGRIDHSLANLDLLYGLARAGIRGELITSEARLLTLMGPLVLPMTVGGVISLLPLTEECRGVTTQGLYYPLSDASLRRGTTLGISNMAVAERIKISCAQGILLVVLPTK